ncbi:MAG: L-threonylcarbamoyladenylate synthase [Methanobacteriaceae archaeon]|nr:L-threonylcarbamoyladenylate synthase [Methanobacteriaceae archaeon]
MTEIIKITDKRYSKQHVINQLQEGKIVVYPTDTIYGIGANIFNLNAVKKVYNIKQRPFNKPLSITVNNIDQLESITKIDTKTKSIVKKLLPGPYTLILKKTDKIHPLLTSNTNKVGIRMPDNRIALELAEEFPITSTSANITGQITGRTIHEIKKQLKDNVDIYLDMDLISNKTPSTIIDLTGNSPKILRKGEIKHELKNIL